eukprot:gene13855-16339_t
MPHVVVIGSVGIGKSTIVELLTGSTGIASSRANSATKTTMAYPTPHGFVVIDTPGNNSMDDRMIHNLSIAQAFNFRPVTLLVVDKVKWSKKDACDAIKTQYGIDGVLFNQKHNNPSSLASDILVQCKSRKPVNININHENFFRYFTIVGNDMKVFRTTKEILDIYEGGVKEVKKKLETLSQREAMDMVFQFQHFMIEQIPAMQSKLANECGFTMCDTGQEFGHVAHLGHQLKSILYEIRVISLGYAATHGVTVLRKCPHCGLVWSKVRSNGQHNLGPRTSQMVKGTGCGKQITWSTMQPVPVPLEISAAKSAISTEDVPDIPKTISSHFASYFKLNSQPVNYN